MTGKPRTKLRDRWVPRTIRRLTVLQRISALSLLGLGIALLLTGVRYIWALSEWAIARSRGPEEACEGLYSMGRVEEIAIINRAPSGYLCEATFADGSIGTQDFTQSAPELLYWSVAFAVISVVTLIGVLIAVIVRALLRVLLSTTSRRPALWGVALVTAASLLIPWIYVLLYFQWQAGERSTSGLVCPTSVNGLEVYTFAISPALLPPYLTCTGHTSDGAEFSTTAYGIPFGLFITVIVLFVAGLGLIITSRFLPKRDALSDSSRVPQPLER